VHGGQQLARVVAASAGGPLAAPLVGEAEPGQPVVAHPGGDDRRPWLDMAGDEGMQRRSGPVSQQRHAAPAGAPLHRPRVTAAMCAFPLTSAVTERDAGPRNLRLGPVRVA
jgi:hypothetical protein